MSTFAALPPVLPSFSFYSSTSTSVLYISTSSSDVLLLPMLSKFIFLCLHCHRYLCLALLCVVFVCIVHITKDFPDNFFLSLLCQLFLSVFRISICICLKLVFCRWVGETYTFNICNSCEILNISNVCKSVPIFDASYFLRYHQLKY